MSARTAIVVGALALVALAVPGTADACAVCFQAKSDASRIAFIATTAAMTLLPLTLVGAFAWWVRKRFRDAAATRDARDASPAPSPSLARRRPAPLA